MKATELRGMPLVSVKDAKRIGKVQDVIVDTTGQRVVALQAKTDSEEPSFITLDRIHAVGKDVITLEEEKPAKERRGHPGAKGVGKEGVFPFKELHGNRVITYDGTFLGTLSDLDIDTSDFRINEYEVSSSALSEITKSYKRIRATPDMHIGEGIITVSEQAYGEPSKQEVEHKKPEGVHEKEKEKRSHHR
ncbi:MAG TPA: PRC-barrel domain-containing protein [Chloroflexota bacterium]|nr:PRC-barrel domain-containing protein [Chloroflexota bacterium]